MFFNSGCSKDDIEITTQIVDIDGNIYHSIIIGNQEWMVENLKVTRLNNGTDLKLISSDNIWKNTKTPAYCWYSNIVNVDSNDGLLYNFYAVNTDKLAPKGWHIPSDKEWTELEIFIGMTPQDADQDGWRGDVTTLKAIDKWYINGDDSYGFNALPSGGRNGYLGDFIWGAFWWTSSKFNEENIWLRQIGGEDNKMWRGYVTPSSGFSVRCIKNK